MLGLPLWTVGQGRFQVVFWQLAAPSSLARRARAWTDPHCAGSSTGSGSLCTLAGALLAGIASVSPGLATINDKGGSIQPKFVWRTHTIPFTYTPMWAEDLTERQRWKYPARTASEVWLFGTAERIATLRSGDVCFCAFCQYQKSN